MGKKKAGFVAGAITTAGIIGTILIASYFPWNVTGSDYVRWWLERPLLMGFLHGGSIIFWGYFITSGCKELYVPGRD